jgi:hypothetical protein
MKGTNMTNEERMTIQAMSKYGGSFVKCLANAALHADVVNLDKLKKAFPEYWAEYTFKGLEDLHFKEGMAKLL